MPDSNWVEKALHTLHYTISNPQAVRNFQRDYNLVSSHGYVNGTLKVDNKPTTHTQKAIATALQFGEFGSKWLPMVKNLANRPKQAKISTHPRRQSKRPMPQGTEPSPKSSRSYFKPRPLPKPRKKFTKRKVAKKGSTARSCTYSTDCGKGQVCVAGTCEQIGSPGVRKRTSKRGMQNRRRIRSVPAGSRYAGHRTVAGYPITYVAKRFGATPEPVVKAVKIAQANGKPSVVGSNILPLTAKVKPTSSIPAAPPGLPPEYDFCVQENGMILRARDVNHKLHGKSVLGSCFDDEETGLRMCSFDVGGDVSEVVPACIEKAGISDPTPVPPACCFDIETSTLVCEGSPLHGLIVEMVAEDEVNGIKIASVEHPDLPGGGSRMPICEPMDRPKVWDMPPPKRPPADEIPSDCCIDEETLSIVCADPTDPEHGKSVADIFEDCVDKLEGRVCRIRVGSTLVELPACHAPPPPPPGVDDVPEIPCLCCFDTDTSTLLCEGTVFHGLKVTVVAIADMPDGTQIASVEHPSLPGGGVRAPMCSPIPLPEPTPEPRPEPVPMPEPYEDYGAGDPQPPPVTEEECIPSSIPHDFDTEHGHHEIIDADSMGYGVGYRGQSSLPGMRGAGQGGGLRFGTDAEIQRAEAQGYGVGYRGESDLPGMRGAGQGEGLRFGTDDAIQEAESRAYGVGYRGESDLPGMRGAGQGEGLQFGHATGRPLSVQERGTRFGSGYATAQDRGYGIGYRGHSRYPGMRGAGQSEAQNDGQGLRFAGFSGRPGDLEPCHGEWINEGPFKTRRDGWKPEMASLQQGGICCVPWGEVGIKNPPSISGDSSGYNTRLWQYQPSDHMMALDELGYRGTEEEMVLNFQSDWNWVSQSLATIEEMKDLDWGRLVVGNLISDGRVGPHTLNAVEIAMVNQKHGLSWVKLVGMTKRSESSDCPPGRRFARTRKARVHGKMKHRRGGKLRRRRGGGAVPVISKPQLSCPPCGPQEECNSAIGICGPKIERSSTGSRFSGRRRRMKKRGSRLRSGGGMTPRGCPDGQHVCGSTKPGDPPICCSPTDVFVRPEINW